MNRGGSWNNAAENCTAANRNVNDPGNANNNLGFRVLAAPLDRGRTNGTDRSPVPSPEGQNRSSGRPVVVSSENPPGGPFLIDEPAFDRETSTMAYYAGEEDGHIRARSASEWIEGCHPGNPLAGASGSYRVRTDLHCRGNNAGETRPRVGSDVRAIEEAHRVGSRHQMSAQELIEQEISFAFGNAHFENDRITREMVAQALPPTEGNPRAAARTENDDASRSLTG